MPESLLQVEDLRIRALPSAEHPRGLTLLEACSFGLDAGERLTLVGESGAGKSLLAQALMGTLPIGLSASGSIRMGGRATNGQRAATRTLWGSALMMLPQEPRAALNPLMRLHSQVSEAGRYARALDWKHSRALATHLMQALGVGHATHQYLHQVSGGMAQRVAVACVGAAHARLLIADEPTKGLDTEACAQVAQLLINARAQGQALLTITHDLDLAAQLGGQIAVLRQGRIVEQGSAHTVLQHPQHPYTQALIAAQPRHWLPYPFTPRAQAQPLLRAQELSKHYGQHCVLQHLDLELGTGEVLAVSGPSGCGKTTLGNVLLGVIAPDAGQVQLLQALPRWKLQKLYQDPPAAFSPFRTLGQALQDLRRLHRLPDADPHHAMEALGLSAALLLRKPHQVSGGELQRLALLRLMQLQPAFIFADEPTSRLDPITQRNTMQLLCEYANHYSCSMLLVSHDADLAHRCSHRHIAMGAATGHSGF